MFTSSIALLVMICLLLSSGLNFSRSYPLRNLLIPPTFYRFLEYRSSKYSLNLLNFIGTFCNNSLFKSNFIYLDFFFLSLAFLEVFQLCLYFQRINSWSDSMYHFKFSISLISTLIFIISWYLLCLWLASCFLKMSFKVFH